ncbi:MAG: hypothetical protein J6V54_08510 [Bacteroidales bacterium]|nr:hypothetical protein [Bacteroidales bacterium]
MKKLFYFVMVVIIGVANLQGQGRTFPCTLAYCLDGRAQNISTGEILTSNPQIGYITFYSDKVVVDNKDVYSFYQERDGVKTFQGATMNVDGLTVTSMLFVDRNLKDVVLFMVMEEANIILKSPVYLMEVADFMALYNQNNGISNGLFVNNSYNTSGTYQSNDNAGTKTYYENRYGYKDCHSCGGTGVCQTCNGTGLQNAGFGLDKTTCANCLLEHGKRTGKCSICRGTGKVYGLK